MSWPELFLVFLMCHLAGDYLLQTDWQVRNKPGGMGSDPVARRALTSHLLTYTLAFVPALIWIGDELDPGWGVLAAALIFLPHFVVDDGRIIRAHLARVKRVQTFDIGLAASVDQSYHVLSLFLVAILLGAV
jgi:hypothetical protein